jgi:soluble lytic murein transglycosylase-like protein
MKTNRWLAVMAVVSALVVTLLYGPAWRSHAAQVKPGIAPQQEDADRNDTNAILAKFTPTGASRQTAGQDGLGPGVESSHKMAQTDGARVLKHRDAFNQAGRKLGLPPALLAAIASRESRGGSALQGGWGDNRNAFGIMQVDKRFHKIEGLDNPASAAHIMQAAGILQSFLKEVQKRHPDWPPERQLQGAVVAYNSGVDNVRTLEGMDVGTTGDDYSNDVWARAQFYAKEWGK